MLIFKKPSELINTFLTLKAQYRSLKLEYEDNDKVKGSIYFKRHGIIQRKLRQTIFALNDWCKVDGQDIINIWKIKIEKSIGDGMSKFETFHINLDSRITKEELYKLVKFNLDCEVIYIQKEDIIELGKVVISSSTVH